MQLRQLLLLWSLIFLCIFCRAQDKKSDDKIGIITGRVNDSISHTALEYATITLYDKDDPKPIDGTTTNGSGRFQLTNIAPGSYTLVAEFIGYNSFTITISVSERNPVVDVKTIELRRKDNALQTIVVTAPGKIIENKIDKMVFNVERDVTSQTGVATDVLKKVPQVSVDVDGNVELAGSSSVRFLINGKPSTAFGSSIADVLQTIPASQIKSIEVITNPGAKYDAQGLGGIINIILKNNTAKGVNGNISLTGGTRMENASFNFNARKGKLGLNAFMSGSGRPYSNTASIYDRTFTDSTGRKTLLHQEGDNHFYRYGYQSGIGVDYTFNDKNSINVLLGWNRFSTNTTASINQTQTQYNGFAAPAVTLNNSDNKYDFKDIYGTISYKKTFAREDEELDISFTDDYGTNTVVTSNAQYNLPQNSLLYATNGSNPGSELETESKIDYSVPFKKDVVFGIGGKIGTRDIISNSEVSKYQPASSTYRQDNYLTNEMDYHQQIYAFYSELSFPAGNLFNAKIGGRYEHTNVDLNISNMPKVDIPSYDIFVPSVFLSKKLGEDDQLKLSYSKRIERPDFRDINPFVNTTDPKNISSGNPYLDPEIGNRLEFGYSKDLGKAGSIMLNVFYRTSDGDIQPYLVVYPSLKVGDSTYTNVSVSTRENIGMEKDAGINLFVDLHFSKLNVRTNLFGFRRNTINAIDPGLDVTSNNFRSNVNISYSFTANFVAEFFGNFNSARHEVQGQYPSFTSYSFALRKQFWNKNASLALTAVNPFSEYLNQTTTLQGSNFTVISNRSLPFRSFGLNFTWKFGKLEFKKEKEDTNNGLNNLEGQ